jgi:predicted enzyme related to lactoylglutathione lyase
VQDRTPISGDFGSWATFSDPSGNVVGLFEQSADSAAVT